VQGNTQSGKALNFNTIPAEAKAVMAESTSVTD